MFISLFLHICIIASSISVSLCFSLTICLPCSSLPVYLRLRVPSGLIRSPQSGIQTHVRWRRRWRNYFTKLPPAQSKPSRVQPPNAFKPNRTTPHLNPSRIDQVFSRIEPLRKKLAEHLVLFWESTRPKMSAPGSGRHSVCLCSLMLIGASVVRELPTIDVHQQGALRHPDRHPRASTYECRRMLGIPARGRDISRTLRSRQRYMHIYDIENVTFSNVLDDPASDLYPDCRHYVSLLAGIAFRR